MKPPPRICRGCKNHIPINDPVIYIATGVYHESCYPRGGRRR